jgi:hypothetical protein
LRAHAVPLGWRTYQQFAPDVARSSQGNVPMADFVDTLRKR